MARRILIVLAVLFSLSSAIAIVYVFGVGSKNRTVRDAARRFHRAVGNPLQMRSAGTPGTYASVIRHRGRTTQILGSPDHSGDDPTGSGRAPSPT
jgi:5,10-methenyltetrahydromethanopterin hydrogenase